jgi:uncharacterized protein YukE
MAKIATISDKQGEMDYQALRIDIKNIRQAINDLNDLLTELDARITVLEGA